MRHQSITPLVSICILAFNHENYIRETLDNILKQETSFDFDVFVHDDASTDTTPQIIKEYQDRFPEIIKPILQTENQFSQGIKPFAKFIYPNLKSEFVAFCEADDYWNNPQKLEKQVAIFKEHKDVVICGHDIEVLYEKGTKIKKIFYKKPVLGGSFKFSFIDEFNNHFVHTATLMIKIWVLRLQPINTNYVSADIQAILFALSKGDGYYIDEKLAVKRRNLGSITHNKEYKEIVTDGQRKMWNYVLTYTPAKHQRLVKLKIAEYDRLFIKNRRKDVPLISLIKNAVFNDPYWFFGLSKLYKNKLKNKR